MERDADAAGVAVDDFRWEVPYLPIDPKDVGRTYEAVIRVNSQSGKGGVAYIMKTEHKLDLPRRLQIEFSAVVQRVTDAEGGEVSPAAMWEYFQDEYLPNPAAPWGRFALRTIAQDSTVDGETNVRVVARPTAVPRSRSPASATARSPRSATPWRPTASTCACSTTTSTRCRSGGDAAAASYLECAVGGRVLWGVGIDPSIVTSSLKAVVSAVNRAERDGVATD